MRRLLLFAAAVLFISAVVCAVVVAVGVIRLLFTSPEIEEGTRQVTQIRPWGWGFVGCSLAGFVTLWLVRDQGRKAAGKRDVASGRPE